MSGMPGMATAGSMGPSMNWQGGGTANNMMPRIGNVPSHLPQMNVMSGGQGMFNPAFDGSAMNAGLMGMQPGFDMGVINQGMGGVQVPGVLGMEQMNPAMMGGNPQLGGFGFDGGQGGWMGPGMEGGMGQQFMGSNGIWDNNGNFVGNGSMGGQSGTGAAFGPGMRQWRNF